MPTPTSDVLAPRVFVNGARVPDGAAGYNDPEMPYVLEDLTISWGRADTLSQPDATTASFALIDPRPRPPSAFDPLFRGTLRVGQRVDIDAGDIYDSTNGRPGVRVFIGQISDVTASYTGDAVRLDVTAVDVLADLGNRDVGAAPWPTETLGARFARIMAAGNPYVAYRVAPTVAGVSVSRMDVDRQQALPLLQDLAASTDAVLWSSIDTVTSVGLEPAVALEDPAARLALFALSKPGTYVIIVPITPLPPGAVNIGPCLPELYPATWLQTMDNIVTGAVVQWFDQSTAPEATERNELVRDAGAESITNVFGVRRVSVNTVLANQADAQRIGGSIVSRLSSPAWSFENVQWTDDRSEHSVDVTRRVLGASSRHGLPVVIDPLPAFVPVPGVFLGYLEGGSSGYAGEAWTVQLNLSSGESYGGAGLRWSDLNVPTSDSWRWQDFSPSISWGDLAGVGGVV